MMRCPGFETLKRKKKKKVKSCLTDATAVKCHSTDPFRAAVIHQYNTSSIDGVLAELTSQGHQGFRSFSL